MTTNIPMKTLIRKFFELIRREWFLIVMAGTIALIVILFEMI